MAEKLEVLSGGHILKIDEDVYVSTHKDDNSYACQSCDCYKLKASEGFSCRVQELNGGPCPRPSVYVNYRIKKGGL